MGTNGLTDWISRLIYIPAEVYACVCECFRAFMSIHAYRLCIRRRRNLYTETHNNNNGWWTRNAHTIVLYKFVICIFFFTFFLFSSSPSVYVERVCHRRTVAVDDNSHYYSQSCRAHTHHAVHLCMCIWSGVCTAPAFRMIALSGFVFVRKEWKIPVESSSSETLQDR